MAIYAYPLISVCVVSVVSLVGVFTLSLKETVLRKYVFLLVSLAVGALIGDAFIHLIPEAFTHTDNSISISAGIIAGILIFFVLEKVLHWHHHETGGEAEHHIHANGRLILFSDAVHNFIDGLIIGASYMVNIEVGIATTLAIMLHEIPQEIGDFGVLIQSGYSTKRALWLNFLSALTALVGVVVALFLATGTGSIVAYLIPFAAGGFVYIAMSDLIPELHKTTRFSHSLLQLCVVLVGLGAMFLLLMVE